MLKERIVLKKEQAIDLFDRGMSLFYGHGVEQNKKEAAKLFKELADLGNREAICKYAIMLCNGEIEESEDNIIKYCYKAAFENFMFFNNFDRVKCFEKLIGLENKIDKKTLSIIHFKYGKVLYFGVGIKENKSKAAECFRKAAVFGNCEARDKYCDMLRKGDGVKKNRKEARNFKKFIDNQNKEKEKVEKTGKESNYNYNKDILCQNLQEINRIIGTDFKNLNISVKDL